MLGQRLVERVAALRLKSLRKLTKFLQEQNQFLPPVFRCFGVLEFVEQIGKEFFVFQDQADDLDLVEEHEAGEC